MKKLFRNILYLFIISLSLNACQSIKDGLTGKKQTNQDEFLVEKKNPLVLPPEFDSLPVPQTIKNEKATNTRKNNLETILAKDLPVIKKNSINKTSNKSLEQSILEKIKKN